jgi:hypothetical protein
MAAVTACGSGSANKVALSSYGSAALGNGCATVDLSFENLTGAASASGSTVNPINFLYTATTPADWVGSVGNARFIAQFNEVVTTHNGGSYTGGSYPSPGAGLGWYFDSLQVLTGPSFSISNVLNTISFTQTYCLGATATAGCTAANLASIRSSYTGNGVLTQSVLSCGSSFLSCTGGIADIASSLNFSVVAVTTDVNADRATGAGAGGSITIGDFGTSFAQFSVAPEPGTFGLLGMAIIGMGLVRRRRQRS